MSLAFSPLLSKSRQLHLARSVCLNDRVDKINHGLGLIQVIWGVIFPIKQVQARKGWLTKRHWTSQSAPSYSWYSGLFVSLDSLKSSPSINCDLCLGCIVWGVKTGSSGEPGLVMDSWGSDSNGKVWDNPFERGLAWGSSNVEYRGAETYGGDLSSLSTDWSTVFFIDLSGLSGFSDTGGDFVVITLHFISRDSDWKECCSVILAKTL